MITAILMMVVCITAIMFNANKKSSTILYYEYNHDVSERTSVSIDATGDDQGDLMQAQTPSAVLPKTPSVADAPVFEEDEPVIEIVHEKPAPKPTNGLDTLRSAARTKDPNKVAQEKFEKYAKKG